MTHKIQDISDLYQQMLDDGYNPSYVLLDIDTIKFTISEALKDCNDLKSLHTLISTYNDLFELIMKGNKND